MAESSQTPPVVAGTLQQFVAEIRELLERPPPLGRSFHLLRIPGTGDPKLETFPTLEDVERVLRERMPREYHDGWFMLFQGEAWELNVDVRRNMATIRAPSGETRYVLPDPPKLSKLSKIASALADAEEEATPAAPTPQIEAESADDDEA